MKHYSNILSALVCVFAVLFAGCTSELTVGEGELDMTVTVGGDSLSLPLGSTDSITIGNFLNIDSVEFVYVDKGGNIFINMSESFEEDVSVADYVDKLTVDGFVKQFEEQTFTVPAGTVVPDLGIVNVDFLEFEEEFTYNFMFEEARESGLLSITKLDFEDTWIVPEIKLSSAMPLPSDLKMLLEVVLPDSFIMGQSSYVNGSTILFEGNVTSSGDVDFQPVSIDGLVLNIAENEPFEIEYTFILKGLSMVVDMEDIADLEGSEINVAVGLSVGAEDRKLHPASFYGKVDLALDEIVQQIDLDAIPDYFKSEDVYLDFAYPYATVKLTSNSGVPFVVDASIEPYLSSGEAVQPIDVRLESPVSMDADISKTVSYWLSSEMPSDVADYEWIDADIRNLLLRIPDRLDVGIRPYSNLDTENDHYIDCNATYKVSGEMSVVLPFAFGEDLYIPVRDTINNIPAEVGTAMSSANVSITGDIFSTFPVAMNISGYFLDSNNRRLDIEVQTQKIQAGTEDSPVSSPLNIVVYKSEQAVDIASMVVQFELLAGTPGVPISENAWVKADISVGIPGGLTLDLGTNNK